MLPTPFGANWDGLPIREAMKWLPKGKGGYSTRVWECQTAAEHGLTLEKWYELPIEERTIKVAARLVPMWVGALDSRYESEKVSRKRG